MGYTPVPVHPAHLLQYAAFLARSLKPSSIGSYLNIIGLLHKEFGLPNPLLNNWPLKSLLTGIKRAIGTPPNQKLPLPPPSSCDCMQLSISLKVLILLFGPYVWLRSMACFGNPTCYLCLLGNSTRLSNSPKVIVGSSPGEHL